MMEFRMGYRSQDRVRLIAKSPLPSPPAHSDDESSSVSMDHPGDMPWSPEEEMMSESSDEEPSKEPLQQTNFDLK
ncbi:hypothetical protein F7725_007316 [Dissostichus mawsoni]|uniref:Uncharacterized protein n=2 Tax=Dissostichus mawsoni TaxID=36200 RepID=A0A7J5XWE9_DISMA|nr:hypothetical protein F7725_007316 [Dissostichus mawsoni]